MLAQYGASAVEGQSLDAPHSAVMDAGGVYEIVFARGKYLAGVHEATDLPAAMEIARRLDAALKEASNGSQP
jgi:hypothetical protein